MASVTNHCRLRAPGPALGLLAVLLCAWSASASNGLRLTVNGFDPDTQVVNFRGGITSSSDTGRPTMCLELSPFGPLSIEACGTGSGMLHTDPGAEIGHFRAKWVAAKWRTNRTTLRLQPGLGFAELQLGPDEPGFLFGGSAAGGIETAGPEASLSLQLRYDLLAGFEMVADINAGAAWMQHAPSLLQPQARPQPFVDVTIGLGW